MSPTPASPPRRIRREIVGGLVQLPSGERGRVVGVNCDTCTATVVLTAEFATDLAAIRYADQDTLTSVRETTR